MSIHEKEAPKNQSNPSEKEEEKELVYKKFLDNIEKFS